MTCRVDGLPCDRYVDKNYFVKGRRCPSNSTCKGGWVGLNHGITNFDNIFLSIITVFQCLTMEGWSQIMYYTMYAVDEHGFLYGLFYYISLILIGSFFMLNLVLGVLSGEFAKEREKVENRRAFLKLRQENLMSNVCESYLTWISKGEDIMTLEASTYEKSSDIKTNTVKNNDFNSENRNVLTKKSSAPPDQNYNSRLKLFIKKLRVKLRQMIKHEYFFWLVISMVAINTIIMATKHYEQPAWLTDVQATAENVFIAIFTFEMLLKIFACGFLGYCRSLFNVFDLVVILLSILELVLKYISVDFSFGLSVLRCLRLLRVFKVTKYWSSLRNLVTSLMNAMNAILSLIFLLFLFIFILTLVGMQLFGGRFVQLESLPRTNFDSFQDAFLTVFQVITGEDWNVVMYDGMLVYEGPSPEGIFIAFIYFFTLVIFGNYTLLNVFLAIAVDNLTNAEILTHDEEAAENKRMKNNLQHAFECDKKLGLNALSFVNNLQAQIEEDRLSLQDGNLSSGQSSFDQSCDDPNSPNFNNTLSINGHARGITPITMENGNPLPETLMCKRKSIGLFDQVLLEVPGRDKIVYLNPPKTRAKYVEGVQKKWRSIVEITNQHPEQFADSKDSSCSTSLPKLSANVEEYDEEDDEEDKNIEEDIKHKGMMNVLKFNVGNRRRILKKTPIVQQSSLYLFSPSNRFRIICHNIVHFRYFDWIIMTVILMSSITLAIEDPLNENSSTNKILVYFDYFFTTVFGLEIFLKVIDRGLVLHHRSYLRSVWNCLDAFVFACNLISIILSKTTANGQSTGEQYIRILRVLRVLRPLKAVQRVKKLKVVFQCMVYSLKNVAFVLIITFLILFIFACIGVQLFQGKFYYCTDPSKVTKDECQGSFYRFESATSVADNDPVVKPRVWMRQRFHFDNIIEAFLTLFISSTGEGWPTSMHNTMDATEIGRGPLVNNRPYMAIYYCVFVVIFTFMIINIYIALIILTFQRQGEKEIEGGLDRNQRDCLQFVLNANPRQRFMPSDKKSFSYHVWYVVDSKPFEYFIMLLIVLNSLQLMMKYDGMSPSYIAVITALNLSFTVLFCIEAALKLIAYGLNYFRDLWNVFDLVVILGSCADLIIFFNKTAFEFIDPSMFRLCRVARIVKLLRNGQSIRIMLWTFIQSFKALPYVTFMLFLLFYIYAIIGMQMFGRIKLGKVLVNEIHENNNFRTIISSLTVLFRSSTGESWNSLMYECYSHALCDDAVATFPGQTCGDTNFAKLYFTSFIFFCMFLLLNLFVAVIMDNFEYLTRDPSILGPHHLQEFVSSWSEFDPQATGKIHHEQIFQVLCQLSPPVGFGRQCPKEIAYKRLIKMNMPVDKDGVSVAFHTTLLALIRTSLDIYIAGNMFDNDKELRRIMETIWPKDSQKNLGKLLPKVKWNGKQLTIGKIYCVKLIILKYRRSKGKQILTVKKEASPSMLTRLNSLLPSLRRHLSQRSYTSTHPIEGAHKSCDYLQVKNPHRNVRKIKSFGGRTKSQNENHTRDGKLRRRSSWSDLPSFFKFNSKETSASTSNLDMKDDSNSLQPNGTAKTNTSTASTPTNTTVNKSGRLSPNYGRQKNNKSSLARTGSLRTNSNGNVVSHHHRKSSNNSVQSLQYDPKGMNRYQNSPSTKPGRYSLQPHSAPTTPRGTQHNATLSTRPQFDHRHSAQGSPLPKRQGSHQYNQSQNNQHRRGQTHPSLEQYSTREPHVNDYRNNNYGVENLSKYDYQLNEQNLSRGRNLSDPRKGHIGIPHQQRKEPLDNQEHYYHSQQSYDQYKEQNRASSSKYVQESQSLPVKSGYIQQHPQYDARSSNSDLRNNYPTATSKGSDVTFRPIDDTYQQQQQQQQQLYLQGGAGDMDYRASTGDVRRPPISASSPQNHKQLLKVSNSIPYKQVANDNSRDPYKLQNNHYQPSRDPTRQEALSPRQQHYNHGGRKSPASGSYDSDLISGTPSKQYYDNMISQINDQIARVSEGGSTVATQPFNTRIQNTAKALEEDDNEWC